MSKSTIKPVDGTKPEEFLPFEAALERMLTAEGGQLLLEHLPQAARARLGSIGARSV